MSLLDKLKEEGERIRDQLTEEGNRILENAKQEADKIIKDAEAKALAWQVETIKKVKVEIKELEDAAAAEALRVERRALDNCVHIALEGMTIALQKSKKMWARFVCIILTAFREDIEKELKQ